MRKEGFGKRLLSVLLALVMVVGLLPASVWAAEDTDYLFFATDRHTNTSIIGNIINNMESVIGEDELEYLGLGGDMVGSGNSHPSYNSSTVLSEVTGATDSLNATNVDIVAGIHDMNVTDDAGIVLEYQGGGAQIYEGDKYYVYGVEEYCISDDSTESYWSSEAEKFVTWANGSTIDKSKVIIVLSHYPLHAKRDDNGGAYYWHKALNEVATGSETGTTVERNVIFFHGHNHTVDSNEYCYNVGDSMSIQNGSSTTTGTIYYTYATAGYLNANSHATLMAITDSTITLTRYGTSGSGTAMTTVKRVSTVTPTTLNVTGTSEYAVGDTFVAPTVTVTYSDGTTGEALASDAYTVTGEYDMNTAGTYTLTYTYTEGSYSAEAQFTFEVVAKDVSYITVSEATDAYTVGDELYVKICVTYTDLTQSYVYLDACTVTPSCSCGLTAVSDLMNTVALGTDGTYHQVTITYGGKSCTHFFSVNEAVAHTDEDTGITISVADLVSASSTIAEHEGSVTVPNAVSYKAYDITPDDGCDLKTGNYATITFPIPDGYGEGNNVVKVYCVDTEEWFEDIDDDASTITVRTNHFSTWAVVDLNGEADTGVVEDYTTGSTTTEKKTVYVLTSSISSGNSYLIANAATAGSVNLVANDGGDLSNTTATVVYGDCDGDGDSEYYIELTDATNELWTVSNSYRFENQDEYLRCSNGSLSVSSQSTTWSYSNNRLSYASTSGGGNGKPGSGSSSSTTYYLRYNNGWTVTSSSSSASNIYFYVPTEVEVEVNSTVTDTVSLDAGADQTVVIASSDNTYTVTIDPTIMFAGADATSVFEALGGSYTYAVVADANGILTDATVTDGVFTLSGAIGEATVRVYYTWTVNGTEYKIWDSVTITASEPYYTIDLHKANSVINEATGLTSWAEGTTYYTYDDGTYTMVDTTVTTAPDSSVTYYYVTYTLGDEITDTIAIKGIEAGDRYGVWAVVKYFNGSSEDGTDMGTVGNLIEWSSSDETIATVDPVTGIITFTGKEGTVNITATYKGGNMPYDTITISVTQSQYSVPADGTSDFPEYPNEGAVRFDKVATAVGNFSETGIAQVELSMTGVPYTTNNAMDVVVMLDMTGSMSDNGMEAAELATIAFMEKIVKNEDGSYNDNRIAVYAFNSGSSSPYELVSLKQITKDTELATATTAIKTASDKQASGGTPFDEATQKCYEVLKAAKTDGIGNNRQQFCVFMSDGGPTSYAMDDGDGTYTTVTNSGSGTTAITTYLSGYSSSTSSSWKFTLGEEYYTNQMKAAGVTIYTVGLLLQTAPSNPSPYSGMTDSTYNSTTDSLTSVGSHYYFTSAILKQMATDESKYIDIFNVNNADNATAKFTAIAQSILEAAKNVVVQDKIADDYTMVFDIPTGSYEDNNEAVAEALKDQEFYIEFVQYALDSNHERTTETSLVKLYLGKENNTYYAASDNSGTKFADPVFTAAEEGKKAYWSTVDSTYTAKAGEIVINVNGTYYKFIADGSGEYNMTSGAYAYGTIDSTTSTSQDLVIITPYFAYSAATRMLAWTVDKLTTVEYALRYFLFLDSSSTDIGEDTEVDAGPYQTNDWATLTYTNFNGNECQQEFPVPQMTWNGAEVSYVFYLVNAAGQPINKSGQVVDFANATFVTDVFTQVVTWNTATGEGAEELNVNYLADELLPDAYKIYDENAEYTIHVYQDAAGNSVFDYFIIDGSDSGLTSYTTTKVYNTKAGTKYADYGTYSAEAVGTIFETTNASGNSVTITTTKQASLDYSDTTVAFAVLWEPALVEDTVVVDFGLDVLINVVQNDNLQNTVSGIGVGNSAYGSVAMNTGVSATSQLGTSALTIDGNTISIENENQIRFHQGDMTFKDPVTFYYESPVEFYEESSKREGYMYSSVTVIPATTIYYEDSFVDLAATGSAVWETVGTEKKATQDQDRPGESQISADLDADNNYGFDSAYTDSFAYSMGSAKKITVSAGNAGRASFTFYGTGFDVIALTSNTTGAIFVKVYSVADDGTKTEVKSLTVDTYYGYALNDDGKWVLSENTPNSLYQVPVMKVEGLGYGKYYVTVTATYQSLFDHNTTTATDETTGETTTVKSGSYDFYLDAIRIYDPTGNQDDTANNAYVADGEGWPQYTELRNNIIAAEGVTTAADGTVTFPTEDTMAGAIFIDSNDANTSIANYVSYGPNNELYLAGGQSVAFKLDQTYASIIADVQIALKVGNGGSVSYKIYDSDKTTADAAVAKTLNTATDLYYSIKDLSSGTIVITNSGESGILSITNIKVTYTQNPYGTSSSSLDDGIMLTGLYMDEVGATSAVMSLRRMNSADINPADPEVEEDQPEINAPEVEENQPEINDPEVEENQPEINDPEVEEDQPEVNDPKVEADVPAQTESEGFFEKIGNFFKKLFGWLFG